MSDWPRDAAHLLLLPEIDYAVYLRSGLPETYPPGTLTHCRDEHGVSWRAVNIAGAGVRRVREQWGRG